MNGWGRELHLPIGVKQEALHNKDVGTLILMLVSSREYLVVVQVHVVVDTVRPLKLYWVVQPSIDCAHHGVHVQSSDD